MPYASILTWGDDTRRPHWELLRRLRAYRPRRPDRRAEVWAAFVAAHDDDADAALGSLVEALADKLFDPRRPV